MPTYNNGIGYFIYVNDVSEVYQYRVNPGNVGYFMNRNQPILYTKSVDAFGQQNVEDYDLIRRQQHGQPNQPVSVPQPQIQPVPSNNYVTRDELVGIVQETIRNEFQNRNRNQRKEN